MIAQFPHFKKITIEDKEEIEKLILKFPPYSDFNLVSMYSWNTNQDWEISKLNENLVVKFCDYVTGEPFYSFLGTNEVKNTIGLLLREAKKRGFISCLRLVPGYCLKDLELDDFEILPDLDNHDYIVSVEELVGLVGTQFWKKRNYINRFKREHPQTEVRELNLSDSDIQKAIEDIFFKWVKHSNKIEKECENELLAIKRSFLLHDKANLVCLGVYSKEELIGFTIDEIVQNGYAMCHFEKGNINHKGIFEFIKHTTASHLRGKGITYLNMQQDLGILGLRKAKEQWNPVAYLKKYIIRKK